MRITIQHRHGTEISGVMTYINLLKEELKHRNIEYQVISTKTDSFILIIRSILWSDIVHLNSNHLGGLLISKLLMKPVIIKYHYTFFNTYNPDLEESFWETVLKELKSLKPKKKVPFKWKLYKILLGVRLIIRITTFLLCDERIACSNYLRDSFRSKKGVKTIYNPSGFLQSKQMKNLDEVLPLLNFSFVGRVCHDKGIDLLIEACHILKKEGYTFVVNIIGDGHITKYKELVSARELDQYIVFWGRLSKEEMLQVVRRSISVVMPSRFGEPAGYIPVEAASVQTCTIAARDGGLPEIVGPYGFLVDRENYSDLAEKMKYVINHPEEALKCGQETEQYVCDHFSSQKTVDDFLKLCVKLL